MGDCKKGAKCNFGHFFSQRQDISRMCVWSIPQRLTEAAGEWGVMAMQFIYHEEFFKLVTASRNGAVCTWNHENGLNQHVFNAGGVVGSLAYTDGHLLCGVLTYRGQKPIGQLVIIDLATKEIQRYDGHENVITQILLIKEFILTAGFDGQVHVWQMVEDKFKIVSTLPLSDQNTKVSLSEKEQFTSLLYHNNLLIAGTKTGKLIVWSLDFDKGSLQLVKVLKAHEDGISRLKLIHGSMVSISEDCHFRIWTEELKVYFDHKFDNQLTDIVLTMDGQGGDVIMLSNLQGSIQAYNIVSSQVRPGVVKLYDDCVIQCLTVIGDAYDSQAGQQEDKNLSDDSLRIFVCADQLGNVNVFKFGSQIEQDPYMSMTSEDKFAS